jgi:hypothetical protein
MYSKGKTEERQAKCKEEYNALMRRDIPKKDLKEDDLKAIEEAKKTIKKEYNELFSHKPGQAKKYGDVGHIMDNAQKELSQYVCQSNFEKC